MAKYLYVCTLMSVSTICMEAFFIILCTVSWVKVFMIIPEFRILRTFHGKSASKC